MQQVGTVSCETNGAKETNSKVRGMLSTIGGQRNRMCESRPRRVSNLPGYVS